MDTIRINSTNYNGQTADITFSPATGGTEVISGITIPYEYTSDFVYGDYSVYFTSFNKTCPLNVPVPNPTISPTGINQYENVILSGNSVLDGGTYIWTLNNFNDVSGNTVSSYTGQTLQEGYFTTTGSSNVSLSVVQGTATATTTNFNISGSTLMFVSTALNSTATQISSDGTNFSASTMPGTTSDDWLNMLQLNGQIVAVNRELATPTKFAQSYDGINWTTSNWTGGTNFRLNKIIYSEFLGKLVAPAADNTSGSFMVQSSDGVNWSQMAIPTSDSVGLISDEKNNLLLYTDEGTKGIYSSPDGVNWTLRQTLNSRSFQALHNKTFGTNVFVEDFNNIVWYSTDGINWSNVYNLPSFGLTQTQSITYRQSDGRMLICSYQTNSAYYSDDGGQNWSSFTMPLSDVIGITYAKITEKFYLVSRTGLIYSSSTGISGWTQENNSSSGDYRFIGEFIIRN